MYFCQPQPERKIFKTIQIVFTFQMVWWDIIINIKSVYKSMTAGWTVFCVEGSEVQCNDYRPPSGHPGHHNYPNIRIIHKLCSASPGGLFSRVQAEDWNILEVYPFISILDMELDMSRDELGSFILHKGANYFIVSLWVLTSYANKKK